jgi:hypothetical protein
MVTGSLVDMVLRSWRNCSLHFQERGIFYTEDVGSMFLQNTGNNIPDFMVSYLTTVIFSHCHGSLKVHIVLTPVWGGYTKCLYLKKEAGHSSGNHNLHTPYPQISYQNEGLQRECQVTAASEL